MAVEKQKKTDAQIALEKQEMEHLQKAILTLTSKVPPRVNEGSYQTAVSFKRDAIAARKAAESSSPNLSRLRTAHQTIQPYYS